MAFFSPVVCHVEARYLILNENQLTGFSMILVSTERCLCAEFHSSLNVNVTVNSYMNSNSCEIKLHNFSQECIDSIIFRTMKPESTCKAAPLERNSLIPLCFIFFLKRDWHIFLFFIKYTFIRLLAKNIHDNIATANIAISCNT